MELKTYLAILWRRKWVILITAVVTVLITAAGVFMLPPEYEASTILRIAPAGASFTDFTYANQLKNTFLKIATSDLVLDEVAQKLGLDEPPELRMENLGNSELMRLTVKHQSPRLAQQAANTAAEILMDLHGELYVQAESTAREALNEQLARAEVELNEARREYESVSAQFPDDLDLIQEAASELELKRQTYSSLWERNSEAQIREALRADAFSVFEPAEVPENPSGLAKELSVALGFMLGLTAGVGLAFLFENLDSTLHTTEQIEAVTQAPVLGKIPTAGRRHSYVFFQGSAPQEEAIRRLRTNIYALANSDDLQALLVTSAEPREGKTTIVVNLANAIAESGRQVVAVDCDLHRPTLHTIFGLSNEIGLSSVLQQQATLDAALQATEVNGLQLLCSGPSASKPAELLDSRAMSHSIEELRQRFDVVLFDTPAIAAVVDAAILAPGADGVLLVVGREKAREESVRTACQQLADVGARPIGIVVNRARRGDSYRYYTHYQRERPDSTRDRLTKIWGIGPLYEKALRALGISTSAKPGEQITVHPADSMGANVTAKRVHNEGWIEQAQKLGQPEVHE